MIIDAHCHVWDKDLASDELLEIIYEICKAYNFDPNDLVDGSGERLIKEMDEAGIDKTVILGLDYEYLFKGKISYKEYNDYVANLLKEYPDRFIGFAGIDPRRGKEAIQELDRCVQDLGFKGVKLWPLTGFYPDDLKFYPFYERVEELGAVILCHTGAGPAKTYLKYCRPAYVDTVAVDFPNIKIYMAHIGSPWASEAITVATKNPNVYFDISAWEPVFKLAPIALIQTLVEAKISYGIDKILFGTDWPLFSSMVSLKEWVEGIKKLKLPPPMKMLFPDFEFTEEDKNKILGENAKKLLGL